MTIEEIYSFLITDHALKSEKLHPKADLNIDLGVEGDDFSELIESFAEKYHVDMSSYRWYFHHGEEGWNLGALIFKPPYKQVERVGVTPEILFQAASTKKWPLQYPQHQLKEGRLDIVVNKVILLAAGGVGAVIWLLSKLGA